ncbi:MAG: malectin domain-containing carbohydrate-binding protein [Capsulimonadaceae bacterium]
MRFLRTPSVWSGKFLRLRLSPAGALLRAAASTLMLAAVLAAQIPASAAGGVEPFNWTETPTAYDWLTFHHGGELPNGVTALDEAQVPMAWDEMAGTPSGAAPYQPSGTPLPPALNTMTQIPSFLLGNDNSYYYPGITTANPPNATGPALYNHLRDGGIISWSAPFTYTLSSGAGMNGSTPVGPTSQTLDSTDLGLGFSDTGTWNAPISGVGTGAEGLTYIDTPIIFDQPASATAIWSFVSNATGLYSFFISIPAVPNDGSQTRIGDAEYTITDIPYGTGAAITLATVRVSQTQVNATEYLAGPFNINDSDIVNVTLDNTTLESGASSNAVVVADSVTMEQISGTFVSGSAAVINATDYPEIGGVSPSPNETVTNPASYWGITGLTVNEASTGTTDTGSPFIGATTSNASTTGNVVSIPHEVRQLVYFGGTEAGTGVVYCVDGFRGGVVWRYQCPTYDVIAISCGASTGTGTWVPDTDFSGGSTTTTTATITTAGVPAPAPQWVSGGVSYGIYLNSRIGNSTYTIPGLTPGATYVVRLHFCETGGVTAPGQRTFNVAINGLQVLSSFDIYNTAGGADIANVQQFTTTASSLGQIVIALTGVISTPSISGIEVGIPNAVNTTPVVARIKVVTDPALPTTSVQKLVVMFADNNGWAYCLDAIGTGALPIGVTAWPGANTAALGQPLDTVPGNCNRTDGQAAPTALPPSELIGWREVGVTNTYWIYRPNPNSNSTVASNLAGAPTNGTDAGGNPDTWNTDAAGGTTGIPCPTAVDAAPPPPSTALPTYSSVTVVPGTGPTPTSPATPATFTWNVPFTAANMPAGLYTVSAHIPGPPVPNGPPAEVRSNQAQYTVTVNGTATSSTPYVIDQTSVNDGYILLTTFTLPTAGPLTVIVTLTNVYPTTTPPAGAVVVADAIEVNHPYDPTTDMPIPNAFNMASPALFVEPGTTPTSGTWTGSGPGSNGDTVGNAYLYLTNSNGTLYSLNPTGIGADQDIEYNSVYIGTETSPSDGNQYPIPTAQTNWWYTLNEISPTATITSAPSILVENVTNATTLPLTTPPAPIPHRIFFATSHEIDNVQSAGRVYAIDSTGPVDPTGAALAPVTSALVPNYNILARPVWSFPDVYGSPTAAGTNNPNPKGSSTYTSENGSNAVRPALGDITGSPVPFYNADANGGAGEVRIYFLADDGLIDQTTVPVRAPSGTTGRLWSIADPSVTTLTTTHVQGWWAYPTANDPNDETKDTVAEPQPSIGAFVNMTPAIGVVDYPSAIIQYVGATATTAGTPQEWTHSDAINTDVKGANVPMLYFGCAGNSDMGFYAIDLDGGATGNVDDTANAGDVDDISRFIYRLESPNGYPWMAPPVLVVNPDFGPRTGAATGYGGVVYATGGTFLDQIEATPVTNQNPNENGPLVSLDKQIDGFGALSTPAIAAADVTDLETGYPGTEGITPAQLSDWIYAPNPLSGVFTGITSGDQGNTGVTTSIQNQMPVNTVPPMLTLTLPIHTYIFDGSTAHQYTSTNMGNAMPMNGTAATTYFDWGQPIYVRFTNVVPGTQGDTAGNPYRMYDPSGELPTGDYLTAAGAVTNYQPGMYNPTGANQSNSYQLSGPAPTMQYSTANPVATAISSQQFTGFFVRSGVDTPGALGVGGYANSDDNTNPSQQLADINGGFYGFATTIVLGSQSTPGTYRRIVGAKQTALIFAPVDNGASAGTHVGYAEIVDSLTQGQTYQYTNSSNVLTVGQTIPSPSPTFGIANPIAIVGGNQVTGDILQGLGFIITPTAPFNSNGAQTLTTLPNGSAENPTTQTYDSADNGNYIVAASSVPKAGYSLVNPITAPNFVETYQPIYAAVAPVVDNSNGNNLVPTAPATVLSGQYAFGLADRSQLGTGIAQPAQALQVSLADASQLYPGVDPATTTQPPTSVAALGTVQGQPAHWYGSAVNWVVNPLPWETPPTSFDVAANTSADYPDIAGLHVSCLVHLNPGWGSGTTTTTTLGDSGPITNGSVAELDGAYYNAGTGNVDYYADTLEVDLNVPQYQPANMNNTATITNAAGGTEYPNVSDGYVAVERVYVPATQATGTTTSSWQLGEAYRDFYIVAGVPARPSVKDLTASANMGAVPSGYGSMPAAPATFNPFQAPSVPFASYFQPIELENDGNVNLLDVRLDQLMEYTSQGSTYPLLLTSNDLDNSLRNPLTAAPVSALPSVVNGSVNDLASSLDPGVSGFNINNFTPPAPANGVTYFANLMGLTSYGPTFHKPRVGSTTPAALTVPDYDPANGASIPAAGPYAGGYPGGPNHTSDVYVGMAIPLGTPAGTYNATVRMFDDDQENYLGGTSFMDGLGYGGGIADGASGDILDLTNDLSPTFLGGDPGLDSVHPTNQALIRQPLTDPGTQVSVKVIEDQLTDATGTSTGILPMMPVTTTPTNNLSPAAMRDFFWQDSGSAGGSGFNLGHEGDVDLLWVNDQATNATNALTASLLEFSPGSGYTPYGGGDWWEQPIAGSSLITTPPDVVNGKNSSVTIAQDQEIYDPNNDIFGSDGSAYAFFLNQSTYAGGANSTTLWCAKVNVSAGTLSLGTPSNVTPDVQSSTAGVSGSAAYSGMHGVRGLKYVVTASGGINYLQDPGPGSHGGQAITNNLWAFWTSGGQGHSAIYFAGTDTAAFGTLTPVPFSSAAALPIPAGITQVSNPSPVLVLAPDTRASAATTGPNVNYPPAVDNTGSGGQVVYPTVPMIEVTYSGVDPDGHSNIYVSRYRPYIVTPATGTAPATIGLAPVPYAQTPELLAFNSATGWWQGRDVGWARTWTAATSTVAFPWNSFRVQVAGADVLNTNPGAPPPSYEKSNGLWVFTNNSAVVYVDAVHGRIRFQNVPTVTSTSAVIAFAAPMARRITMGNIDTQPVSFVDTAFAPNPDYPDQTQLNREWFIWRRLAPMTNGTVSGSQLYFDTQRLTVPIYTQPGGTASAAQQGSIAVYDDSGAAPVEIYSSGSPSPSGVYVDPVRGRLEFPATYPPAVTSLFSTSGPMSPEGHQITVEYTPAGTAGTNYTTDFVRWMDEPRHTTIAPGVPGPGTSVLLAGDSGVITDPVANPKLANVPGTGPGPNPVFSVVPAGCGAETAIPDSNPVNESMPDAFLDPLAYADIAEGARSLTTPGTPSSSDIPQPHNVWLFWSSTRNAVPAPSTATNYSDLFYEVLNPNFSAQ